MPFQEELIKEELPVDMMYLLLYGYSYRNRRVGPAEQMLLDKELRPFSVGK